MHWVLPPGSHTGASSLQMSELRVREGLRESRLTLHFWHHNPDFPRGVSGFLWKHFKTISVKSSLLMYFCPTVTTTSAVFSQYVNQNDPSFS